MLADVLLLSPEELPAIDDLTLSYENLEELLDPKLLIGYAFKLCKHGGQAWCENVFTLWTSALLSLSSNQVGVSEKTNIPWFVFSVYILLNSIKLHLHAETIPGECNGRPYRPNTSSSLFAPSPRTP